MERDPQLTEGEHAALRRVVDEGVTRLDRRRRGRNAVASGAVAIALVAGIVASSFALGGLRGEPAPVATATRTPSATPTPTGSASPTAAPSPSPTEAPLPTPTATAPATPTTPPDPQAGADPAQWTVTQDGIGPLTVGMPFDAALAAVPDPQSCSVEHDAAYLGADQRLWAARDASEPGRLGVVQWVRYDVEAPDFAAGPRTAEGIGLGSSVADVRTAYPDVVDVSRNGQYLQVGRIYFDVTRGVVNGIGVTPGEVPWEFCG